MNTLAEVIKALTLRYPEIVQFNEHDFRSVWFKAGGEMIAGVSIPDKILDGCLFVIVKDSVWLAQLNLLKGELIEQINQEIGKAVVKDIRFKIGRLTAASGGQRKIFRNIRSENIPADVLEKIAAVTCNIEDDKLKKRLSDIMRLSYLTVESRTRNP